MEIHDIDGILIVTADPLGSKAVTSLETCVSILDKYKE